MSWSAGTRRVRSILALMLAGAAAGCSFLSSTERRYASNRDLIAGAGAMSGYTVDPELFTLIAIDLRDDSVTYQYRGVEYPGDHAWVVHFSEKSSEQNPLAVRDVYALLPAIQEGREGFEVVEEGEKPVAQDRARFVRYRFTSPIHDGAGKPLSGHGIVASCRIDSPRGPVIQHAKLDNHGDRDGVVWADLSPFLPVDS